jgi:hypothetical protein
MSQNVYRLRRVEPCAKNLFSQQISASCNCAQWLRRSWQYVSAQPRSEVIGDAPEVFNPAEPIETKNARSENDVYWHTHTPL